MIDARRAVEALLEVRFPHLTLGGWITSLHREGVTLPEIAERVRVVSGIQVSPDTIARWIRDG